MGHTVSRTLWLLVAISILAPGLVVATSISDSAFKLVNRRAAVNRGRFFVYQNADSAYNHGYPTRWMEMDSKVYVNPQWVDTINSGGSDGYNRTDRGTVIRIDLNSQSPKTLTVFSVEQPVDWSTRGTGEGYDLRGAKELVFDIRTPTPGGVELQFGVAGSRTDLIWIPRSRAYTTISIPLGQLGLSEKDLDDVHRLFTVAVNAGSPAGDAIVFLDNIQFEPIPYIRSHSLGFPLSFETFAVRPYQAPTAGHVPFPPDQVNRNVSTIYDSSLALLALLQRGGQEDLANARLIAETFHYALHNDDGHLSLLGDSIPHRGLRNGYQAGDIAPFPDQGGEAGHRGPVRLPGFSSPSCAPSYFCLLLDGATGGNNSFAMLALLAAYEKLGEDQYLDDVRIIAHWIYERLLDSSIGGFGGYFHGFPDAASGTLVLVRSKSTENNADIFAAFSALAIIENRLGNFVQGRFWRELAYTAGDFVMNMYHPATGCFSAGTVPREAAMGPGVEPHGAARGREVINVFEFLDATSFAILALAAQPRYRHLIDWRLPAQCLLSRFKVSVSARSESFTGYSIVAESNHGPTGVAWEFTAQTVVALRFVDSLHTKPKFEREAAGALEQIAKAQSAAPYTDGLGLVASTLQDGARLPREMHCLWTPFQCIPQRVGLAATNWAIFADLNVNPFNVPYVSRPRLDKGLQTKFSSRDSYQQKLPSGKSTELPLAVANVVGLTTSRATEHSGE